MARARRTLDPTRLAQLTQRPGADTRTWVSLGVVEEVVYSAEDGILLAVRMVQGALAGEVVACELAHTRSVADMLITSPVTTGELAVCVLPEGDGNAMPVAVGFLRDLGAPAPGEVNGRTIDLALISGAYVLADKGRSAELELGPVRLVAPSIKLAAVDPTQPYVRGKALAEAVGAFCTSLSSVCTTMGSAATTTSEACVGPLAALKGFFTLLGTQLTTLGSAADTLKGHLVAGDVLSTKISGE